MNYTGCPPKNGNKSETKILIKVIIFNYIFSVNENNGKNLVRHASSSYSSQSATVG